LESFNGFIPEKNMNYDDNFQFNEAEWNMVNRATEIYEKIKSYAINL